jgi:hypothetical protein
MPNINPNYPYVRGMEPRWNVPALPLPSQAPDILSSLFQLGILVLGIYGAACVAGEIIDTVGNIISPPSPRRRRRRPNTRPVSERTRHEIISRDGRRCTYCGRRVTHSTAHVDHSVSRVNGGTNHKNNLRTACRDCNLVKGPLNAQQFRRLAYY